MKTAGQECEEIADSRSGEQEQCSDAAAMSVSLDRYRGSQTNTERERETETQRQTDGHKDRERGGRGEGGRAVLYNARSLIKQRNGMETADVNSTQVESKAVL